jgi:hypothetical protein
MRQCQQCLDNERSERIFAEKFSEFTRRLNAGRDRCAAAKRVVMTGCGYAEIINFLTATNTQFAHRPGLRPPATVLYTQSMTNATERLSHLEELSRCMALPFPSSVLTRSTQPAAVPRTPMDPNISNTQQSRSVPPQRDLND